MCQKYSRQPPEIKQSTSCLSPPPLIIYLHYSSTHTFTVYILSSIPSLFPCLPPVYRRRGPHDKNAPGLLTDSSAVICMSKATCCRSERGYPARIPGIPIPNGKPAFRVLVGSFLMRFRSGPGFSVMKVRGEKQS